MTDAERLEWACGVLNKHKHLESSEWFVATLGFKWFAANLDGDEKLLAFEAIAIALALDEQARRKLPESEQAEWAAAELSRRHHAGCVAWKRVGTCVDSTDLGGYHASTAVCALSAVDAVAIAESLVRREMLGDTSDASSKEVSQ